MIKLEHIETYGWEAAIRGMRNPLNSWEKSDSGYGCGRDSVNRVCNEHCPNYNNEYECGLCGHDRYVIGKNDLSLMKKLRSAGADHGKFMRFIQVAMDITAPLYWWKEYDTYKVGTVANSCSTMHKIADKEFTLKDFSCEYLTRDSIECLENTIKILNKYRNRYVNWATEDMYIDNDSQIVDKIVVWWQMIQLLPAAYNQKRTVLLNYEVLRNMYHARKNHKLDEWVEFCKEIEKLPYANELIIGGEQK